MDERQRELDLYQEALRLEHPWYVKSRAFDAQENRLDIYIGVDTHSTFTCSVCGTPGQTYYDLDVDEQAWRHLDFWEYKSFLHAPHPRVQCAVCGKVKYALVPWGRFNSSFTVKFEMFVLTLVKDMPVLCAARLVREWDKRLWRIIHHYVDQGLDRQNLASLKTIAVDETSSRRGHHYVTVVMDSETRRVVFATPGKDAATIEAFGDHLKAHGGDPQQIQEYCSDMSAAFMSGMAHVFPQAQHTVDKFHVMKLVNEAVDEVRRAEQAQTPELKKTRYIWLKNERNLTKKQQDTLATLSARHLHTAKAYQLKVGFQELWGYSQRMAGLYFDLWYFWATHSRLEPMIAVAQTLKTYRDRILRWFETKMTNGMLEALNGLIQAAKRKARGYRTTKNLIAMIYLIGGGLRVQE
ncbi:MAG: ISL3 family transposase [Bacilli bacterium]